MAAYYNEFDPKAAAWLRELIKQGHIADGVVDDRSIEDVTPTELAGFTQCHFFAGIGVWSYALRRAGWADDRAVWTGSCPCQPFSAAGKGAGFDDERHLWPAFHHLISQCRPDVVLGEQVASKDGLAWLDLVCADLEATGYASGAVDLCAAGVGAPHIRQRLWWVGTRLADTTNNAGIERCEFHLQRGWQDNTKQDGLGCKFDNVGNASNSRHIRGNLGNQAGAEQATFSGKPVHFADQRGGRDDVADAGASDGLADTSITGLQGREWVRPTGTQGSPSGHSSECGGTGGVADASGIGRGASGVWDNGGNDGNQPDADVKDGISMADTAGAGQHQRGLCNGREFQQGTREAQGEWGPQADSIVGFNENVDMAQRHLPSSPTNGHWRDADWLFCRDGKWRPVEPGTSPLAHGSAARVGRLRGYGNAIVAQAAQAFVESVM